MTVLNLVRGAAAGAGPDLVSSGGREWGPDTFHLRFEPGREPVVHAVTRAASFVNNVDSMELDPLSEAIDPAALEQLLSSVSGSTDYVRVEFTYAGLDITVDSAGNIWLRWD